MLHGQIYPYYLLKIPLIRFHRLATCLRCDPAPMPVCDNGPWLDKQSNTFEMQQTLSQWTVLHGKEPFTYDIRKIFRMLTPSFLSLSHSRNLSILLPAFGQPPSVQTSNVTVPKEEEERKRERADSFRVPPIQTSLSLSHGPPGLATPIPL